MLAFRMRKEWIGTLLFGALCAGLVLAWYVGMLPTYADMRDYAMRFESYAMNMPLLAAGIFAALYIAVVAFSIPVATPLSVIAGFMFGTFWGVVIVVFSATVGATGTFVLARYFFRDAFERRASRIANIASVEARLNGFRDVLIARLVPAVPFALINAVAGLTRVSLRDYMLATALGIVPFTFVYVHAGQAFAEFETLEDVASSEAWMFVSRIALVVVCIYLLKRWYAYRAGA